VSSFARARAGLLVAAAAGTLLMALLTACGGGGNAAAACPSPSSGAGTLTVTEKDFSIELASTELSAGRYEITVCNAGGSTHDLAVEKDSETVETSDQINPGESTTLTVDLEAGDYVFYCSIANHRQMGMEIDVTVS
jgi:plastocyanin